VKESDPRRADSYDQIESEMYANFHVLAHETAAGEVA
jgi:hypothetical protein